MKRKTALLLIYVLSSINLFSHELIDIKVPIKTNNELVVIEGEISQIKKSTNLIVIVVGSGEFSRNQTHKLFSLYPMLVEKLNKMGFSTLMYDKRGCGKSTGDFSNADIFTLTNDVKAIINFVHKNHTNFIKIGLLGHSEGSNIISNLASQESHSIDFLIALAGPMVDGKEITLKQLEYTLRNQEKDFAQVNNKLSQFINDIELGIKGDDLAIIRPFQFIIEQHKINLDLNKYPHIFRTFLTYDPKIAWKKVKIPTLFILAENDWQVDLSMNHPIAKEILVRNSKIFVIPKANHSMFIDEKTISSQLFINIADFLGK